MSQVYAPSVVAPVTDEHPGRNRAISQFVGKTVRDNRGAVEHELAVPMRTYAGGPVPAPVGDSASRRIYLALETSGHFSMGGHAEVVATSLGMSSPI